MEVDIIEIGFLKNSKHAEGSTSFQRVEEIEQYIAPKKEGTLYVALVDYGRYDLQIFIIRGMGILLMLLEFVLNTMKLKSTELCPTDKGFRV